MPLDDASSTVLKMDAVERAERVVVTWSEAVPEAAGRDLFELARSPCFCCSVEEVAAKLQPAGAIYFAMDEDGNVDTHTSSELCARLSLTCATQRNHQMSGG